MTAARHPSFPAQAGASLATRTPVPPGSRGRPREAAAPTRAPCAGRPLRGGRDLPRRAALAAVVQRRRGDRRALRELYAAAFSFLRYFHHRWREQAA